MNSTVNKDVEKKYDARKKYLRAKETAHYLSIGLSTVWLYAKQGKLTAKKLSPRVTVFDIDEINKLFDNVEVA